MTSKKLEVIADPDRPTIVTRRAFDAPREIVFDAWTKPEQLRRWLGPRGTDWVSLDIDLRVGGGYRWVSRGPDGKEYAFRGEYHEIVRPEKLVATFVFELMPEHEAIDTLVFEERDGKTTVTSTTVHKTIEARDGHLASGMEVGLSEGYDKLDALLASLRPR